MNKLLALALASAFAMTPTALLAADPPKDAPAAKKTALDKPANVTAEAWAKMTDAEKAKAVEAARAAAPKEAAAKPKKEKKGGC